MKNNMLTIILRKTDKVLAIILSAVLLVLIPCPILGDTAVKTVISSSADTQTVTSGVIHKTIKEFTSDGWLSIHILQVDLTNPSVKLEAITNTISSTKLTNVKSIAASNSAIAAVNANYFYGVGNGNANALGPAITGGKIVSVSDGFNSKADSMATFSLNASRLPSIDYWKTSISITSPKTGAVQSVSNYNRMSSYYFKDIIVLDHAYGDMSLGASEQYPNLLEMVVSDGVVKEIRVGQPAVEIPENGYVVVSYASDTNFLVKNFQVGDPVTIDLKSNIDWKNVDFAVSGSSVLLKDGVIPSSFSFADPDNNKRNPRTLIGSSQDSKTLYIVTVDGRQNASIGMTLEEAAKYMLELGAYNALNLDGGGSTTLVSRPLGSTSISLDNTPSDGGMRGVTTALGIISTAPASQLAGLVIESEDGNVFVNTSRKITVRGYDKYFNPVEVNPLDIKWKVSGIKGTVSLQESEPYAVFVPSEVGLATLTASIGNIKKTISLYSLSSPIRLTLNKSYIKTSVGASTAITVTGYNKNGYLAQLNTNDVKFSIVGNELPDTNKPVELGSVNEQGVFAAKESGTGYIDVSVGNIHAYCALSIMFSAYIVKDTFESETGRSFSSYPEGTVGSFSLSKDYYYRDSSSGKLSYNFVDSENTKAAYINYPEKAMLIDEGYENIGIYANIPETNDAAANNENQVKLEIVDGDGKAHLLMLSSNMNWTGWKYLQTSVRDIKSPAYITKLYVVSTTPGASCGDIYFDRLFIGKAWYETLDEAAIPTDTVPVDTANVPAAPGYKFKATSNSLRFSVMGQASVPSTDIQKALIQNMTSKINKYLETGAIVGNCEHAISKDIKKDNIAAYKGFKSYTVKNSLFVQLDMSTGSLRTSNLEQWNMLQSVLKSTKAQNVFLFLAKSPDEISDKLEAKLFKDTLTDYKLDSGKNVWVFYNGSEDKAFLERGVYYVSSCGYAVKDLNKKTINSAKYFLVTVKGSTVTYELKPMNS